MSRGSGKPKWLFRHAH